MSILDGQQQPMHMGSGGALTGRLIEARSAEGAPAQRPPEGPGRAPGTLKRSGKVYGATPSVPEVVAEAPQMSAGSQLRSGDVLRNGRPHGSAAGGSERCSVNRRCSSRIGERRWSR